MGKRQLLFVTYRDEKLEEGISYAIELARAMYEDITLLLVQRKSNLMDKFEDLMTAVSFAEADEHETARQIMAGASQSLDESHEKRLAAVVKKCGEEGIQVKVEAVSLDAISGIRKFLKEHAGIDKVVLSPVITEAGSVTSRDLNRLVRTASRPIVTMTRQACAVA
jgi:cellobiose-specific phosphotransferase system component IIA